MRNLPRRWPREAGRKPSNREMNVVRQRGLATLGSQNAVVAAMLLRKEGVAQPQIVAALGAPHRNKIKQLCGNPALHIKVKKQGRVKVFLARVH